MTPADFARVDALFHTLAGLDADARQRHFEAEADLAPALRTEVESLLAAHDALTPQPPTVSTVDVATDDASSSSAHLRPGDRVGAYRLTAPIGQGGMGEVFHAERVDGVFDRGVAVKVMRPGALDANARRRFDRERHILASLDHPNVVRLLDGGVTEDGAAYFVMEYVPGVPITEYCTTRRPGLAERLRLLRAVCDGLVHAHQHGVVHRDLKPGNVLVTPEGVPKVLDFGVAALVSADGDRDGSAQTIGLLPAPLTPDYASPEQLRGRPVTAAADVYALGVLSYEVLTDTRPYIPRGTGIERALAALEAAEPPRPSAAVGTRTLGQPAYGHRQLRGDLDAIVGQAMARDLLRRYASARELAADLDRLAARLPVSARPPSPAYVVRRFAARHRALVTTAAAAAALVLIALAVAMWQWREARDQQRRAEQRFDDVRQLANAVLFDYQGTLRALRGATELRARMAADSLAYLDRLAVERSDDPELLADVARGYIAVAEVQGATRTSSVGQAAAGLRSLERAAAILGELDGLRPGWATTAALRADHACTAARVEPARAREHGARCLAGLQPLAEGRPADDPLALRLGDAHLMLAEAGDLAHAEAAIQRFAPLAGHPALGRRARLSLALAHRLVGWDRLRVGDAAGALAAGEASRAAVAPLVAGDARQLPMEQSFIRQLIGHARLASGDVDGASAALEASVDLARAALQVNPGDAFLEDRAVLAHAEAARALEPVRPGVAARLYREGDALAARLPLTLPTPHREQMRADLRAGAARFGPGPVGPARGSR